MAGITAARAWQTVKPHIPLIKFRKGGLSSNEAHLSEPHAKVVPSGSSQQPKAAATTRPVIEDYQLPLRYRRQLLDEKEIEYINRGGPE